jgi:HEPN domain-containing protein
MPNNQEKSYQEWIKKAKEDELTIKSILKHRDVPPGVACFHSQQMAEKYLKGLLVFYNKDFPKIHDLIELETLLLEKIPEIKKFHSDFKLLNRYYIETRYPGDYPEFSFKEAIQAFEAARRIKKFVLEKINIS